ncbi:MAG: hypothetical protein IPO05_08320 [Flavobacteriales bacterium]|nr:hypothetical protein [Flavobacteriales bacterium]MBK9513619.1 hypothetical protein [Flavobacteriales bacterium]MBP7449402.1 hypothetical protein [Flavobacteriales bacterium]HOZ39728.1 hypothetical protein [Flavobacteriales bacterium]
MKGIVKDQRWPSTLMGLGIFVGLGSMVTVVPWTLIAPGLLFRIFLILCFAGNLFGYARSGLRLGMERLEWFLFNLLAVGPIVMSLLLWLNYLGHGPEVVTDHDVLEVREVNGFLVYTYRDDFLREHHLARWSHRDSYPIVGNRMHISLAAGLLGVPVVVRKQPFVSGS